MLFKAYIPVYTGDRERGVSNQAGGGQRHAVPYSHVSAATGTWPNPGVSADGTPEQKEPGVARAQRQLGVTPPCTGACACFCGQRVDDAAG